MFNTNNDNNSIHINVIDDEPNEQDEDEEDDLLTPCSLLHPYFNFSRDFTHTRAKCKIKQCDANLIVKLPSKATGNFSKHLRSVHKAEYAEFMQNKYDKQRTAKVCQNKLMHGQQTINFNTMLGTPVETFQTTLSLLFATTGCPHILAENPLFAQLLNDFGRATAPKTKDLVPASQLLPDANSISKRIKKMGDAMYRQTIEEELQSVFVTLAIDGWTPHTFSGKNTNIIAHTNNHHAYLLKSDYNEKADSAEKYLVPLMENTIRELWSQNVAAIALVSDNAANMVKTFNELAKKPTLGKLLLCIGCSAHTVQLMFNTVFEQDFIMDSLAKVKLLLDQFKTCKKLRIAVREVQLRSGVGSPLKIIYWCVTRWNAIHLMLQRLLRLRPSLSVLPASPSLTEAEKATIRCLSQPIFWQHVEALSKLCSTFQLVTNMVQSDKANIVTLSQALKGLKEFITGFDFVAEFSITTVKAEAVRMKILQIIEARISEYLVNERHELVRGVEILTDAVVWDWDDTEEAAREWLMDYIPLLIFNFKNHFPYVQKERHVSELKAMVFDELADFNAACGVFSNKAKILKACQEPVTENSFEYQPKLPEGKKQKLVTNWKKFWASYLKIAPALAAGALALLSLTISEASCERSFSLQQLTHSKTRNRMRPELVEAEMRLRFNKDYIRHETDLVRAETEEGSDVEPEIEDSAAHVRNLNRKRAYGEV